MAKAVYYGIGDVARKVKKMYYGVNGVARKVKKGYIGVNGVARLFFSGEGKISYSGRIANMTGAGSQYPAAATVGGYAIFTGGYTRRTGADAFSASLTHTSLTGMSVGRQQHAGARAGNYALFAGGWAGEEDNDGDYVYNGTIDVYDSSLTRLSPISLGYAAALLSGESAGDYAIFAGGYGNGSGYDNMSQKYAHAISPSLTRTRLTDLGGVYGWGKREMGSCSYRNYAVFGPGVYPNVVRTAFDIYDDSLTRIEGSFYATGVGYDCGAAAAGDYAVFAGGNIESFGTESTATAVALNSSLTVTSITSLSRAASETLGAEAGDFAVISCGYFTDIYDANLTRTTSTEANRYTSSLNSNAASTSVGDYALFGGGYRGYSGIWAFLCS